MDKLLIAERFAKATATYSHEASVQRQIADTMIRLLARHLPTPCPRVIEFGCGTGVYSQLLLDTLHPEELLLNDLCPAMLRYCEEQLRSNKESYIDFRQSTPSVSFLLGDAETIPFPAGNSLITSCSALQWFEQPERFFRRCHALLESRGYLAFSTFGTDNMREVRALTGYGLPYRSLGELTAALAPRFDILHTAEERIPLLFDNPMRVLYHLKQTGVNGLHSKQTDAPEPTKVWTRSDLLRFCEQYIEEFTVESSSGNSENSGSVCLTYHPIYIIARKR